MNEQYIGDDPIIFETAAEAGRFFDVTERTIHTWIGQGCPAYPGKPGRRGIYPMAPMFQWLIQPGGIYNRPPAGKSRRKSRR